MSVEVKLERTEDGKFRVDLGSKALPRITWDPGQLSPEDRQEEHLGARLLLAAALACFVNTMAGDLQRAEASRVADIRTRAVIEKDQDSTMRTRYNHIELDVETAVDPADREKFEKVRSSLLRGSLVTYSLEEEIDVDYNIEAL